MQEDIAPVDREPADTRGRDLSSAGHPGIETATVSQREGELLELRLQLDLAQLDHPSRWGRLTR